MHKASAAWDRSWGPEQPLPSPPPQAPPLPQMLSLAGHMTRPVREKGGEGGGDGGESVPSARQLHL